MKKTFFILLTAFFATGSKSEITYVTESSSKISYDEWFRVPGGCGHHGKNFSVNGLKYQCKLYDTLSVSIIGYEHQVVENSDSTLYIPASVTHEGTVYQVQSIGPMAFSGLNAIHSITIGEGIKIINDEAFTFCTNLRSVYIPASVDWLSEGVFGSCPNLNSIVVSEQNPDLDSREGCNAVIETENNTLVAACPATRISPSVKAIGDRAFYRQGTIEEIVIPEGVESIGRWAFWHCSNLKSISLPQSLRKIEHSAFMDCHSLRSLRIPKNVEYIGGACLARCYRLSSVVVEKGNPAYDSRKKCNAIIRKSDSTLIAGCRNSVIMDGVRRLDDCFEGVPIRSVHIPKSVTDIHWQEFYGCDIDSITVDEDNPVFSSPKGSNAILSKDGKTLVMGCHNTDIPEGVEIIRDGAFSGRWGSRMLQLPGSIKKIEGGVFDHNDLLEEVIIPRSVEFLGEDQFYHCKNLIYAKVLAPLKEIRENTFADCPKLHFVEFAEGTKKICFDAFRNCPNLRYVYVPESCEMEYGVFEKCPKVEVIRTAVHINENKYWSQRNPLMQKEYNAE